MRSTAALPYSRALVVANPIAGRGQGRRAAEELARGLEARGLEVELFFTGARGDARERARCLASEVDLVVCAGGDGTLGEVLAGLAGDSPRSVPVALLPVGTANVMSLDLGLPRTVAGAIEMIAGGRTTALDTARVNEERLSFLVTGIGFDAMAVADLESRRAGPIRRSAYVASGLRALARYEPPRLEVEVDGTKLPGSYAQVLASNVVHYAGLRVLSEDRRLDDGLYEIYLFPNGSRLALAGYALRALLLGLPGGSCVRTRGRVVRVSSDVPVPCHVDGDAYGRTPVAIAVHPVQSRLLVP
jgi:diacylglycerol kinase (ATP)